MGAENPTLSLPSLGREPLSRRAKLLVSRPKLGREPSRVMSYWHVAIDRVIGEGTVVEPRTLALHPLNARHRLAGRLACGRVIRRR